MPISRFHGWIGSREQIVSRLEGSLPDAKSKRPADFSAGRFDCMTYIGFALFLRTAGKSLIGLINSKGIILG